MTMSVFDPPAKTNNGVDEADDHLERHDGDGNKAVLLDHVRLLMLRLIKIRDLK